MKILVTYKDRPREWYEYETNFNQFDRILSSQNAILVGVNLTPEENFLFKDKMLDLFRDQPYTVSYTLPEVKLNKYGW